MLTNIAKNMRKIRRNLKINQNPATMIAIQTFFKIPFDWLRVRLPLKVPRLARSVPKPLKVGQAQACERAKRA